MNDCRTWFFLSCFIYFGKRLEFSLFKNVLLYVELLPVFDAALVLFHYILNLFHYLGAALFFLLVLGVAMHVPSYTKMK